MKPSIRNGGLILLGLMIATAILGYLWLQTSLPQTTGSKTVHGLTAPAEIIRDENGVPHIFANTEGDAAFALGFAHAQDRLWQMEFTRRLGAGRLSEVIGRETLETDKFLRALGLYRIAERQAERLTPGPKQLVHAYASGVNAFLETHTGAWPPEFVLLNFTPATWRAADSLVWAKLMAFQLSVGWRGELLRAALLEKVGTDRLRQLFPVVPLNDMDKLTQAEVTLMRGLATALPTELETDSASNAWIIDGTHSKTGKPILANDPHLGFSAPGLWYLARISVGDRTWAGATVPGVPLFVLGQNGDIAWGMTTTGGDTSDLFIEVVDPSDPGRYLAPNGPTPFRTREETIRVEDEDPVTITIRESRHGPVMSDIIPRLKSLGGPNKVVALASTALDPKDDTVTALYQINQARNVTEFKAALPAFGAPMQNLFVADGEGNIGFAASGRMPVRKAGRGHLPSLGVHERGDWSGYVDPSRWPQSWNPPGGIIANANNRLAGEQAHAYAWYWPESHRFKRIYEVLRGDTPRDVDAHIDLQMDNMSVAARSLMPLLIAIDPADRLSGKALNLMRDWDYRMDRDRPEPLIYAAWIRHLMKTLVADELDDAFTAFSRPRPYFIERVLREDQTWCDVAKTDETEDCASRVAAALAYAVDELGRKYGDEPTAWRWGDAHAAIFPHRIFRHIPVIAAWSEGRIATSGGDHTVNRGQTRGSGKFPYHHTHGSGYRAVYDLAHPDNSRFSVATGQSGNPFSKRYMAEMPAWRDGRYLHIAGSRKALKDGDGDHLLLAPTTEEKSERQQ